MPRREPTRVRTLHLLRLCPLDSVFHGVVAPRRNCLPHHVIEVALARSEATAWHPLSCWYYRISEADLLQRDSLVREIVSAGFIRIEIGGLQPVWQTHDTKQL